VLFLWRQVSGWRCCGQGLRFFNYLFLLYLLLLVLLVYALYLFIYTALQPKGKAAWDTFPAWMRPFTLGAPPAACIVFMLSCGQTLQHVREIQQERAPMKHDRAVQIIALPAVYGVMAMSSLARMFQMSAGYFDDDFKHRPLNGSRSALGVNGSSSVHSVNASSNALSQSAEDDRSQLFISKSETCFWVGDLYEAWALFQFGKLTLDLITISLWKQRASEVPERREPAQALLVAHTAVASIAWLGVALFLLVCIMQAGWSLYLLTFTGPFHDWSAYNVRVKQFGAAGMVASAGAMYNIHVVESTFHSYFEGYRPVLKFVTVKIIVSFAFFQKGLIWMLKGIGQTLPDFGQKVLNHIPLIGDLVQFSEEDFQVFYDSLILYECILISLMHIWAWSAYEDWYLEDCNDEAEEGAAKGETQPLLQDKAAAAGPEGERERERASRSAV